MAVKKNDHWDKMASFMRDLFLQTDDERIGAVYKKLHAAGWDQREFPLSTRNADKEIKWAVLDAIAIEIIDRREKKEDQGKDQDMLDDFKLPMYRLVLNEMQACISRVRTLPEEDKYKRFMLIIAGSQLNKEERVKIIETLRDFVNQLCIEDQRTIRWKGYTEKLIRVLSK